MPSSLPVCSSYARGNDALTGDPTQIFPRQGSLAERCADPYARLRHTDAGEQTDATPGRRGVEARCRPPSAE